MKKSMLSISLLALLHVSANATTGSVVTPIISYLLSDSKAGKIDPSTQTSQDVKNVLYSAEQFETLDPIDPKITLASGYGGYHFGVDEDNKSVVIVHTRKIGYSKKNIFICRESSGSCRKIVDNTALSNVPGVSEYIDGKIYLNMLNREITDLAFASAIDVYDIKTDTYTKRAFYHPGLNGETRSMRYGTDGYLYIGGIDFTSLPHYPSMLRLNPKDFTDYTFYKNYWTEETVDRARSIASDDTHTYQVVGDNPFRLIALNRATGKATRLHSSKNGILRQLNHGAAYEYNADDGTRKFAYLYQGTYKEVPTFDEGVPWQEDDWAWRGYFQVGNSGIPRPSISGEGTLNQVYPDINGIGQASFTATVNGVSTTYNFHPDVYAQDSYLITKLDNYLFISGNQYNGDSRYNLLTGESNFLGAFWISQYVLEPFLDYSDMTKKLFISGYGSGATNIYTPADSFSSDNLDGSLDYIRYWKDMNYPEEDLGIHRPLAMIQVDEEVYIIGQWQRDGYDGALAWYNTKTGEMSGIHKGVFENYQTRSIIKVGDLLAISTQAVDNSEWGGSPRPSTPKIMMFNPKTKKFVKEYFPTEGLNTLTCGRIATLDDRHIIGISNDMTVNGNSKLASKTFLYIIDTYTDEIVMKKTIDYKNQMLVAYGGTNEKDGFDFKVHNGYIYTWLGDRNLVRIDKNGAFENIGVMPYKGRLEFDGDTIFIAGREVVLRIKNKLKQ